MTVCYQQKRTLSISKNDINLKIVKRHSDLQIPERMSSFRHKATSLIIDFVNRGCTGKKTPGEQENVKRRIAQDRRSGRGGTYCPPCRRQAANIRRRAQPAAVLISRPGSAGRWGGSGGCSPRLFSAGCLVRPFRAN